ncbi:Dipeptidyl aminopeptidase [Dinochytrium kinnereticum]|nr:Dipeptidyl aminopeptidase [Dinochytrium kinnereticum]
MSALKKVVPFGLWASPISTEALTASAIRIQNIYKDGDAWYHVELRPVEQGRSVIIRNTAGASEEINVGGSSARSEVHEYGGAGSTARGGICIFTEARDRRLFLKGPGNSEPVAITSKDPVYRFADLNIHPSLLYLTAVREHHVSEESIINELVCIEIPKEGQTGQVTVIASGKDFFTAPRFSPDGKSIAWIQWQLPEMPWTESELVVAKWHSEARKVVESKVVEASGSVSQPRWASSNDLYYCCDKTGFYNIYRHSVSSGLSEPILEKPILGDFSSPDWTLGASTYDFTSDGNIVAGHTEAGIEKISLINPKAKTIELITKDFVALDLVVVNDVVYMHAGSKTTLASLVSFDLKTKVATTLKKTSQVNIEEDFKSVAQVLEIQTEEHVVYANYYAPKNPNFVAPTGELPPLIVSCHGGPTACTSSIFSPGVQFWTSRGFAWLDVNYSGSSGFGTEYRNRLNGTWGIADVNDVCNAALHLAKIGLADPKRLCVRGGSAGGFTVLAVLAFKPEVFAAGTSLYGICDLVSLAKLTHKFESRYIDILMGGSVTEIEDVYIKRSPIHSAGNISAALLVLQGQEDRVVPPNQAELIVDAVKKRNGVVEYQIFEGEGHGWKKAENIQKSIETELAFYLKNLKIQQ